MAISYLREEPSAADVVAAVRRYGGTDASYTTGAVLRVAGGR